MSFRNLHRLPLLSSHHRPLPSFQPKNPILRTYAATTKGDAPNASNVATPQPGQSVSADDASNKASRATDSSPMTDSASLATPVSNENLQKAGEKSHDADPVKQDPSKPAEEKRREVEKQGERALGVEDQK